MKDVCESNATVDLWVGGSVNQTPRPRSGGGFGFEKEKKSQPTHNPLPQPPVPSSDVQTHRTQHTTRRAITTAVLRRVQPQVERQGVWNALREREYVTRRAPLVSSKLKNCKVIPVRASSGTPSEMVLTSKVHAVFFSNSCNLAHIFRPLMLRGVWRRQP